MKKIGVFFVLFIISIPALALEKSLLIENFSLVDYSGNNIRKTFDIDIFSERIPFSIIDTAEYTNLIMANMYDLLYGQKQDREPEIKSKSLAEGYLRQLAERARKNRKIAGPIIIFLGGAWLVASAVLLSKEELGWEEAFGGRGFWAATLILPGIAIVAGGASAMFRPSRAERELDYVLSISDPSSRERAGYVALSSLAARSKKQRILSGVLLALSSVTFIGGTKDEPQLATLLGAAFGVGAVYNFASKTPTEKAFQKYLKERQRQMRVERSTG